MFANDVRVAIIDPEALCIVSRAYGYEDSILRVLPKCRIERDNHFELVICTDGNQATLKYAPEIFMASPIRVVKVVDDMTVSSDGNVDSIMLSHGSCRRCSGLRDD